jgi:MFS family permease
VVSADAARAARSPLVYLLATVLFINYVDRGVLPTAAELMQADLHLTASQLGLLGSAFFWTYALVQVPVGWLAERVGADRVLAAGLVIWASATLLLGLSSVFPMLIALRMLLGIGESSGFPCVNKLLAMAVPVQSLGTANGIVGFAYLFGPAVGTFCGGLLMAHFGWRAAFLVFGALSLLWLYPWSRIAVSRRAAARPMTDAAPALLTLVRCRALWGTGLGLFSANYAYYFVLLWLPYYLVKERGYSTLEMAKLAGLAYVVTAVSALACGWATDRFIARGGSANFSYKGIMFVAHAGAVLCMLAMAFGPRPLAIASIFLYQALTGAASPGMYAIPQILGGAQATGRWVGIQNSLGNLAGVIAPAATGFIIDATGHFTAAFVLSAAVSLLGLIGWIVMLPRVAPIDWVRRAAPPDAAPVSI